MQFRQKRKLAHCTFLRKGKVVVRMNSENDSVNEDCLWRRSAEEVFMKQKYQSDLEVNEKRKTLLKLKTEIATVQLKKEQALETEANLKIKINEILYHKVVLDYNIAKVNYQTSLDRAEETKEEKEELMEIAVEKVKPKTSEDPTKEAVTDKNLTNYPFSDSE